MIDPTKLALSAVLIATSAWANLPGTSDDELKCMIGTSKNLAKFVGTKEKCVAKCWKQYRAGLVPGDECVFPYDGATRECALRAEAKAFALIVKGCPGDCPDCYENNSGSCTLAANARVAYLEASFDTLAASIWCDDSGSGDGLTNAEAKCQDVVGKVLAKFTQQSWKCEDKCVARASKGAADPPVACKWPATDPATTTCIAAAAAKGAAMIDKACVAPIGDAPECAPFTGATWTSLFDTNIGQSNFPYCGLCEADTGAICWFQGEPGANCDQTCADQSLTYSWWTLWYAGIDGSAAACKSVLDELRGPEPGPMSGDCSGYGLGCAFDTSGSGNRLHCATPPTNATDSFGSVRRACACD